MTILVVLLGMMAGLAWFMPDKESSDQHDETDITQE